jgi:hypothetical protein
MSVIEVSFSQRHIRTKYQDIWRPDKGVAGTREFGLKIGTFPQKSGWVATLPKIWTRSRFSRLVAPDMKSDYLFIDASQQMLFAK